MTTHNAPGGEYAIVNSMLDCAIVTQLTARQCYKEGDFPTQRHLLDLTSDVMPPASAQMAQGSAIRTRFAIPAVSNA